jgi:hypothetical protein
MSHVLVVPELLATAATDLEGIGSTLSAANVAAAAPTVGVLAAGADEVSAALASLFAGHAQTHQALSAQAATFHQEFVQALSVSGSLYASAEAANASPLLTEVRIDLLGNTGSGNFGGGNHGNANLGNGNNGSQNVGSGNLGNGKELRQLEHGWLRLGEPEHWLQRNAHADGRHALGLREYRPRLLGLLQLGGRYLRIAEHGRRF